MPRSRGDYSLEGQLLNAFKTVTKVAPKRRWLFRQARVDQQQMDARRKAAVRWFNRLYFEVRRWNKALIDLLHEYPGFKSNPSKQEYKEFYERYHRFVLSVSEEERRFGRRFFGEVPLPTESDFLEEDLCTNLQVLASRLRKDFCWLYEEDRKAYEELANLVAEAREGPFTYIQLVREMSTELPKIGWHSFYDDSPKEKDPQGVIQAIHDFESKSQELVRKLHEVATEAGIHLLTVEEYEEALSSRGSTDEQVLVIGEVTMSQDTINISKVSRSVVNVKSRLTEVSQTIGSASGLEESLREQLKDLFEKLETALESSETLPPDDAERVLSAAEVVATEASRQSVNDSFLKSALATLKTATEAVRDVAPTALQVVTQILKLFGV